jgi:hypothetical protein
VSQHPAHRPSSRRGSAIDPALLFGISLTVSLVLWWPSLRGALDGTIDITDAGLRYLAALGLSWVGVFGVATLVAAYGRAAAPPAPPALPPPAIEHPLRRGSDAEGDAPHEDATTAEEPAA